MALNKREQQHFANIEAQLDYAFSLGWPTESCPQPMTSEEIKALGPTYDNPVPGWFYNAYLGSMNWGEAVTLGCSSGHSHSRSRTDRTDTQDMGRMYRTKAEALLALRWDLCRQMAKRLAAVDAERAKEQLKPAEATK